MKTVSMPSSSATRQACWPPAPPKHCSAKRVASWPFCTETCLMALAMLATAMRRKPSATRAGPARSPVARGDLVGQGGEFRRDHRRRRAAGRRSGRRSPGNAPAGSCRRRHWRRSRSAGRRGGSRPGPGSAPAQSGPTRKRAPSKCRIEPPPAATVLIAIIGARMRTPATCGLEGALELAGVERHVGRGAAHVEADDLVEPGHARRCAPRRQCRRPGRTGWRPCLGSPPRRRGRRSIA